MHKFRSQYNLSLIHIYVGVSGPGVVKKALEQVKGEDFGTVSETIKKTAFKITRMGQLVVREASKMLNSSYGIEMCIRDSNIIRMVNN